MVRESFGERTGRVEHRCRRRIQMQNSTVCARRRESKERHSGRSSQVSIDSSPMRYKDVLRLEEEFLVGRDEARSY